MELNNYSDDPSRVNPPNDCEIDEQAYEQLVTDKALELLADDSNYLLVAEAFEDLPDQIYELFEDAALDEILDLTNKQDSEALGHYLIWLLSLKSQNCKKSTTAFGEYVIGIIFQYFRKIADMKLG